ncbi:MAG: LytTR family DNA-binding domain-containing protein [Bacilli bacterium]|nr:LytTR family DNA-binding domain-containing protein [Bacilli bacterium]
MKQSLAIIEDDDDAYQRLLGHIERFGKESGMEFITTRFISANPFLNDPNSSFHVVFMDIELPDIDGLTAARRLREKNKVSSLIFVTNLAKYAQYGYEVDAISYLVKPVTYESFVLVFRKALASYTQKEEYDYIFKIPGGMERVAINKIVYVEILSHIIIYHLVDGTIEKTGTMSKVEKLLAPHGFLRCHNAYLVNPAFIRGIEQNEILVGAEAIPLSRGKKKAFLEGLSHYYLNKKGKDELL